MQPSSNPPKNGRKGSKKVRTGCFTCKQVSTPPTPARPCPSSNSSRIRRIKCDETKPSCLRCTKTGRKCDGYASELAKNPESRGRPRIAAAPGQSPDWDETEQRAFHFYRQCSAGTLFSHVTASFWTRVIPTFCFQEPAIRHAVFAISNLHETGYRASASPDALPIEGTGYPAPTSFAAIQYGKALRALQCWKPSEHGTPTAATSAVPLLACALFICIEFMLGNKTAAQIHINQGRHILSQYNVGSSKSPTAEMVRKELVPIYTRLTLASFLFGSTPTPIPLAFRWTKSKTGISMPASFDNLADAEQALFEVMDDSLRFVKEARLWIYSPESVTRPGSAFDVRLSFEREQMELLSLLEKWHVSFASLRSSEMDPRSQTTRLYFHTSYIFMATSLSKVETRFDAHTDFFASIVRLATTLLDYQDTGPDNQNSRFTFESGIIPPVYFTAIKCRDPLLRRAALRLLKRRAMSRFKENLWDSQHIYNIAERVISWEEIRARRIIQYEHTVAPSISQAIQPCTTIPEAARIKNAIVGQSVGGGSWVTFLVDPEPGDTSSLGAIREFVPAEEVLGHGLDVDDTTVWGDAAAQHHGVRPPEPKSEYMPFHVFATIPLAE